METESLDMVVGEYAMLERFSDEMPELIDILASPTIKKSNKKEIVRKMEFSRIFQNYLYLLLDKQRFNYLLKIKNEFDSLVDKSKGITMAVVKSARPLSSEQEINLKNSLKKSTGMDVDLMFEIDETLIGGISVQIGDTLLDSSIKNRLDELLEFMNN